MLMRSCDFGPLLLTEAGYHTQQHGLCFHPCLGPHPPPPTPPAGRLRQGSVGSGTHLAGAHRLR